MRNLECSFLHRVAKDLFDAAENHLLPAVLHVAQVHILPEPVIFWNACLRKLDLAVTITGCEEFECHVRKAIRRIIDIEVQRVGLAAILARPVLHTPLHDNLLVLLQLEVHSCDGAIVELEAALRPRLRDSRTLLHLAEFHLIGECAVHDLSRDIILDSKVRVLRHY